MCNTKCKKYCVDCKHECAQHWQWYTGLILISLSLTGLVNVVLYLGLDHIQDVQNNT